MEKHLNSKILKDLKGLYPQRIENLCSPGTPDLECCGTWIESKYIATMPKHGNVIKLSHFTTEQRAWHRLRHHIGETSYVALLMGNNYYLFNGNDAALHLGVDWTLPELVQADVGFANLRKLICDRRTYRSNINALNYN